MQRRTPNAIAALVAALAVLGFAGTVAAGEGPDVPQEYAQYFEHYQDDRSYVEKFLNAINLTNDDLGRSFALIAGVANYPKMSGANRTLPPAAEDIEKLKTYLIENEFFDEIVVLRDDAVNFRNLNYFLKIYFPKRLQTPKSRFLFAYSGHGMNEGKRGFLLTSSARHLADKENSIDLSILRTLFSEVIEKGHHVLALINACYSGPFVKRPYGGNFLPTLPGAHAITAGGTKEPVWHDPDVGTGSVFFEKLFKGLEGRADIYPKNEGGVSGDGLVTALELSTYLIQEVRIFSDDKQNPRTGDISPDGSQGSFFFLNRNHPIVQRELGKLHADAGKTFGVGKNAGPTSTDALKVEEMRNDRAFWESIEDSNNLTMFEAYLRKFPKGTFAEPAAIRRDFLLLDQENVRWQLIRDSTNEAVFDDYLKAFPGGTFSSAAILTREVLLLKDEKRRLEEGIKRTTAERQLADKERLAAAAAKAAEASMEDLLMQIAEQQAILDAMFDSQPPIIKVVSAPQSVGLGEGVIVISGVVGDDGGPPRNFKVNGVRQPLYKLASGDKKVSVYNSAFRFEIKPEKGGPQTFVLDVMDANGNHTIQNLVVEVTVANRPNILGKYFALIIGSNKYDNLPTLKTSINDATGIAKVLVKRYLFDEDDVRLLINATRRDIMKELSRYRRELGAEDRLLLYYSGHSQIDPATNEGFWQPVDADPDSDFTWIANADVRRYLDGIAAKHVLVISDSYFSGSLTRGSQSQYEGVDTFFGNIDKFPSRKVISSGGTEPVANSGSGGHSVFTYYLIEVLRTNSNPYITSFQLYDRVAKAVINNSAQTPQFGTAAGTVDQGNGDFTFILR